MQRRRYLGAAGAAGLGALAGCLGVLSSGSATGTLATRVSDQPGDIGDFESCVVTVDTILVRPARAEETGAVGDADATAIDADGATADLVELQGDESKLVNESDLGVGEYEWLKIGVDQVDATLEDGGDAVVTTPGDAPLTFHEAFEIREGTTTSFTADFTPVTRGRAGRYVLQPVAKEVTVTYGDGSESG